MTLSTNSSSCSSRTLGYQQIIKDKNAVISGIQMENSALKGALRDSVRLLQSCVGLFQTSGIPVPEEIAQFLGQSAPKTGRHVKKGFNRSQVEEDHKRSHA